MPLFRRRDPRPAEPPQPTTIKISHIDGSAVATGNNNQQYIASPVTRPPADPAALDAAIAALRAAVESQGGSRRTEALAHVQAIDSAAHATPPDGTKLAVAADWIRAALPAAAPAIARVIEHPTLDTVVTAAAQAIHDTAVRGAAGHAAHEAASEPTEAAGTADAEAAPEAG